ncbi:MAG: hypothetical protein LLG06_12890 [Desulfobacteraceae bacterium]|nr:hypothetical protein [Desulfobacteraceae bacterium]
MADSVQYDFREFGYAVTDARDLSSRSICLDVGNSFQEGVIDHHHVDSTRPENAGLTSTVRMVRRLLLSSDFGTLWPGVSATKRRIERLARDSGSALFILHRNPDLDSLVSAFVLEKYILGLAFDRVTQRLLGDELLMSLIEEADRGAYSHPGFQEDGNIYFVLETIKAGVFADGSHEPDKAAYLQIRRQFFDFLDAYLASGEEFSEFARGKPGMIRSHDKIDEFYRFCLSQPTRAKIPAFVDRGNRLQVELKDLLWLPLTMEMSALFNVLKVKYRKDSNLVWAVYYPPQINERLKRHRLVLSVDGGSELALFGCGWHLQRFEKEFRTRLNAASGKLAPDYPPISSQVPRPGYDSSDPWFDGRNQNFTIVDSPNCGTVLGELGRRDVLDELARTCPRDWFSFESSIFSWHPGTPREDRMIRPLLYLLDYAHPRWPSSLADGVIDCLYRQIHTSAGPDSPPNPTGTAGFEKPAQLVRAVRDYLGRYFAYLGYDLREKYERDARFKDSIRTAKNHLRESIVAGLATQCDHLRTAIEEAGCGHETWQ